MSIITVPFLLNIVMITKPFSVLWKIPSAICKQSYFPDKAQQSISTEVIVRNQDLPLGFLAGFLHFSAVHTQVFNKDTYVPLSKNSLRIIATNSIAIVWIIWRKYFKAMYRKACVCNNSYNNRTLIREVLYKLHIFLPLLHFGLMYTVPDI